MNRVDMPEATPLYAAPEGLKRPLRVVLVGPSQVPGWVDAFRRLASNCDWIEMTVLVAPDAVLPHVPDVPFGLRAFVAFEHALLGANRSLSPVPMSSADEVPSAAMRSRIDALHPDLVIMLGSAEWGAPLTDAASWSCWHIDASLVDPRHAGLSLLAPMFNREPATQMALTLRAPGHAAVDLAVSWGKTRATSFLKQREDAFRKLPGLLLRGLHRLAAGYVNVTHPAVATVQLQNTQPLSRTSGARALLSITRASPRWLTSWTRNGRIGWTLVLRLGGAPLDPEAPVIGSHALLKAHKGWWGDPCVVSAQGRKLIFVEEMLDPKLMKANIACVELVNGGAHRLGVALDEPGHVSFPQAFEWEGNWYMTIESGYDRRVSLYQATDFPLQWTRVRDLVTGWVCVDPTLHHHEGRWYLFANVAENNNSTCDELFLFVADSLDGPFLPHPASPIVCDVRRARMAGRLFHHRGRLIRPAQDCGPGYGNAVVFNEVLELSPSSYREHPLSRLAPHLTRRMEGCHTYNLVGGIEVLDVLGRPPSGKAYLQVFNHVGTTDASQSHDSAPSRLATPRDPHPGTSSR